MHMYKKVREHNTHATSHGYHADDGARWSNFRATGSPYDNVTLFGMTLVVCCYCIVYGMFVWYLDNVWPWQYGIPKDPLFFSKASYVSPCSAHALLYLSEFGISASQPSNL
ncbi:hypothetical protein HPB50_006590 [Hyalomma asiaticum]|uniref:Uncharacterized protein n=1 Tax=Hyalomma asiaticum TaxID=266040 RepID=A0ACB7SLL6_HYAAI|nr:hypothetical protein HPB50_006590 [Hyalomma asiaticum]